MIAPILSAPTSLRKTCYGVFPFVLDEDPARDD